MLYSCLLLGVKKVELSVLLRQRRIRHSGVRHTILFLFRFSHTDAPTPPYAVVYKLFLLFFFSLGITQVCLLLGV